jgi:hypothetical protein
MRLWECELQSHSPGKQSSDQEKTERRHYITHAYGGVVHCLEPAEEAFWFVPDPFKLVSLFSFCGGEFKLCREI